MTTLADLANRVQGDIDDETASEWPQALVEQWCVEAIRDYNRHFPRVVATTLNCSDGVQEYDLPFGFRDAVSVEYPAGEDPPEFLTRKSRLGSDFWGERGFYDVVLRGDATSAAQLVISVKPSNGETIDVEYEGDHDLDLESTDQVSMPARHEGLVTEFVLWRAWLELLATEQQSPTSNSSLMMSQYASNADRAKRSYVESLARALRADEGKSARVQWHFDKWKRIY